MWQLSRPNLRRLPVHPSLAAVFAHPPLSAQQEISITGATVFVNPYKELLAEEAAAEEAQRKAKEKEEQGYHEGDEFGQWWVLPPYRTVAFRRAASRWVF